MSNLSASETLALDASSAPAVPVPAAVRLGRGIAPDGHTIGLNNQYLILDEKPWLPVMGEFQYSRFPRQYWEEQLLKMKAAGINVVSTYVIWQHHQDKPGPVDFSGNRDLRAFIDLCKKHGLLVFLRPGPWVHGEVRFGGLPDFVVDRTLTRSNDPQYLAFVEEFYRALGAQVRGLLWKNGGPVIGVQIENEYNRVGPLQGREHIATLKSLLIHAGFDVPFYSVTGWDNAIYPRGEVIPVFGSYVDEPWATSAGKLPPKSSYVFQYNSRLEAGLGAVGGISQKGDAEPDLKSMPFIGVEYGAGVPTTYRRRPLLQPADVAAMVTTKLGSGVNLLGYYMFQGGQNPVGIPSREENTSIGGFNDLPKLGYDFAAPLGEYGQAHPVLASLKPLHAFLNAFGDRLAPMSVYAPSRVPADSADLHTLRWSVRSSGTRAFLFVNNHVRQYRMATHLVRFDIKLTNKAFRFPEVPVRDGDFFIWPVNFDLSGIDLAFATLQPVTRFNNGAGDVYVFTPSGAVDPQIAFNIEDHVSVSGTARCRAVDGKCIFDVKPDNTVIAIEDRRGRHARIMIVTNKDASRMSKLRIAGSERLIISEADVFADGEHTVFLRQIGNPQFDLRILPALPETPQGFVNDGVKGAFQSYTAQCPPVASQVGVEQTRAALPVPPLRMIGPSNTAVEPAPESFGAAAIWRLIIPPTALKGASDAFLRISYVGDVARLFSGPDMIDDQFYDGRVWEVGLKRYADRLDHPLDLAILPLRQDAQITLDDAARPAAFDAGQIARVFSVSLVPEYEIRIKQ